MLSKANIKYIKSLQVKKYRKEEQCFVVEGAKSVLELLRSDFEVVQVLGTAAFLSEINTLPAETIEVSEKDLAGLGDFQTNNAALAVAKMKPNRPVSTHKDEFALILDDIRDPGNFGTIIRTADWYGWYGISKVIASNESADFYNTKVINATMGSFTRVNIFYTDLVEYLASAKQKVFGAYLEGSDIHTVKAGTGGLILIGNESHGIRNELEMYVTDKITVPRYGQAESLNAAIATAIICDNIKRGT
jgi:RNA methyltransferase, TrmH family